VPIAGPESYRVSLAPAPGVTSDTWEELGGFILDAADSEIHISADDGALYSLIVTDVAGGRESGTRRA